MNGDRRYQGESDPIELTSFIPEDTGNSETMEVVQHIQTPGPQHPTAPQPPATPDSGPKETVRDRIVVLGRRRSGKTIFLARLYEQLWQSRSRDLHMRSLDGNSHLSLMRVIESLKKGEWPAATGGNTYSTFELTFDDEVFPLVSLDYPGEVFRRAFVEGIDAPDTKALLEHVDSAMGVLCLIDPGNLLDGDVETFTDDEFGMVQALDRIRKSPGGDAIPIALVLTKCDIHHRRIKRNGGTRAFVKDRLLNVIRIAGRMRFWAAAAVRSTKDARDQDVPDLRRKPEGVLEPTVWCLEQITLNRKRERVWVAQDQHREQVRSAVETAGKIERNETIKKRVFWTAFILIATIFGAIVIGGAILYNIKNTPESSSGNTTTQYEVHDALHVLGA